MSSSWLNFLILSPKLLEGPYRFRNALLIERPCFSENMRALIGDAHLNNLII